MSYKTVRNTFLCYQLYNMYRCFDEMQGNRTRSAHASEETTERVLELAKKIGIHQPLSVWGTNVEYGAAAWGSNLSGCRANIVIKDDTPTGVIAHEIIHIRENHIAKVFVAETILFIGAIFARTHLGLCANITGFYIGRRLMDSHFENEADSLALPYLSVENLGEMCSFYYDLYNTRTSQRSIIDKLMFHDPHLSDMKRFRVFEEELFNRQEVLPLEVEIQKTPDSELVRIDYTDESIQKLRKLIQSSKKREHWVNLRKIVYKPYLETDQIEFRQSGSNVLAKFDIPDADHMIYDVKEIVEWKIAKDTTELEETQRLLEEEFF